MQIQVEDQAVVKYLHRIFRTAGHFQRRYMQCNGKMFSRCGDFE